MPNDEVFKRINMLESWLKDSFWALSNLTASETSKNGQNPVLEKFINITEHDIWKGKSSLDQLIQ